MAVHEAAAFDMIRRLRVADYLTLSNAFCGGKTTVPGAAARAITLTLIVTSLFLSMQQNFIAAYALIFLGYEFDRYDGIVARMRNECSERGQELDSLSDLVTFVLAPAVMLYSVGFQTTIDQILLGFWTICGVSRLARFNVIAQLVPKGVDGKALYQEGLSTAYAALILATTVAVSAWMDWLPAGVSSGLIGGDTTFGFHLPMVAVFSLCAGMISRRLRFTADLALVIPALTALVFAACWTAKL